MSKAQWKKILLPVAVVLASIVAAIVLAATKPQPERTEHTNTGTLVEVETLKRGVHATQLQAKGTVVAAQKVTVQPELSGRVVWQSAELVPGGRFKKDEPLLRIDARDYKIAVESRRADVRRAKLELSIESGRSDVAKQEWEAFGDGTSGTDASELATRQPQMESAVVQYKAAKGVLQKAELDLNRTTLRAPFNAMVVSEGVDLGQFISPQTAVATLVGIDEYWVQVSVPVSALNTVRARRGDDAGSTAKITQVLGEATIQRSGEVIRQLPDLDPGGAMARLLVTIHDPLGGPGELPLLLGSFVDVRIDAGAIEEAILIPRYALRDGTHVYLMNDKNELEIRQIEIGWSLPDAVLAVGGLSPGERLVVSRINTPVPNMLLRTNAPTPKQP